MGRPFVAIDFETADNGRDSACQVGLCRVDPDGSVRQVSRLIRPPRRDFIHTSIHGIAWVDVEGEPEFGEVMRSLGEFFDGAAVLVAHNAPFDRAVMLACCRAAGIATPTQPWVCTLAAAKAKWGRFSGPESYKLQDVCRFLGVDGAGRHDAGRDAAMCAAIYVAMGG